MLLCFVRRSNELRANLKADVLAVFACLNGTTRVIHKVKYFIWFNFNSIMFNATFVSYRLEYSDKGALRTAIIFRLQQNHDIVECKAEHGQNGRLFDVEHSKEGDLELAFGSSNLDEAHPAFQ